MCYFLSQHEWGKGNKRGNTIMVRPPSEFETRKTKENCNLFEGEEPQRNLTKEREHKHLCNK